MAEQNELKTSPAVGLSGTESPVKSPVDVPALSWVYVMSVPGRTKIGLADDVMRRRSGIEKAIGQRVELHGVRSFASRYTASIIERQLHREFAGNRLLGEWFDIDPATASAALKAVSAPPKDQHIVEPLALPSYEDRIADAALRYLSGEMPTAELAAIRREIGLRHPSRR